MDFSNSSPKETRRCSKDGESSSSNLNHFLDLPEDVTAVILRRLGSYEILKNAQRVCSLWRKICKDPSMWRVIDMRCLDDSQSLDALCRQAVDRSQGQLIELYIDHFNKARFSQLLDYVSERSSKLRCLHIWRCTVVDSILIDAIKNFPLLEELHFLGVEYVWGSIEPIGRCCSMLKSFTLNSSGFRPRFFEYAVEDENDVVVGDDLLLALAIAKSMPGLRHLQLVGSTMKNIGFEAILAGCPNLESLNIQNCLEVYLGRPDCARIAQKIRDFKGPHHPTELPDWDAIISAQCSAFLDEVDSYCRSIT